mmetsp:Transcript_58909/g.155983  ORF Transcript_58909/g.155983 Transcript_58909/m.155983 type:complete len:201 (-) Transcript_58909:1267-1869(-)
MVMFEPPLVVPSRGLATAGGVVTLKPKLSEEFCPRLLDTALSDTATVPAPEIGADVKDTATSFPESDALHPTFDAPNNTDIDPMSPLHELAEHPADGKFCANTVTLSTPDELVGICEGDTDTTTGKDAEMYEYVKLPTSCPLAYTYKVASCESSAPSGSAGIWNESICIAHKLSVHALLLRLRASKPTVTVPLLAVFKAT